VYYNDVVGEPDGTCKQPSESQIVAHGATCAVEFSEKPYIPDVKTALAEIIDNSAVTDEQYLATMKNSMLATIVRENGQSKTGALLTTRGRGLVFMEWETGFVYQIPSSCCKKSKYCGITVLTLSDAGLRKKLDLHNIFTARSLF
jgi:hypothetical protein